MDDHGLIFSASGFESQVAKANPLSTAIGGYQHLSSFAGSNGFGLATQPSSFVGSWKEKIEHISHMQECMPAGTDKKHSIVA